MVTIKNKKKISWYFMLFFHLFNLRTRSLNTNARIYFIFLSVFVLADQVLLINASVSLAFVTKTKKVVKFRKKVTSVRP